MVYRQHQTPIGARDVNISRRNAQRKWRNAAIQEDSASSGKRIVLASIASRPKITLHEL